jgi:hypothetical protein
VIAHIALCIGHAVSDGPATLGSNYNSVDFCTGGLRAIKMYGKITTKNAALSKKILE